MIRKMKIFKIKIINIIFKGEGFGCEQAFS
jgi:hypothetical protein